MKNSLIRWMVWMERKLQGDTGSTRSLSSRGDGFGRKGVISFVDVDGAGPASSEDLAT